MAIIICLETSSTYCSLAISDNAQLINYLEEEEEYRHIEVISILFKNLLKESGLDIHDLDAVAISAGPGSFTGLRVGTSFAKGICFSLGIPLIGIETLQSLALASMNIQLDKSSSIPTLYCPMIEARKSEVYFCIYDSNGEKVFPASTIDLRNSHLIDSLSENNFIVFSGKGSDRFKHIKGDMENGFFTEIRNSARHLVHPAHTEYQKKRFANTVSFIPIYLKEPNITKAKNPL